MHVRADLYLSSCESLATTNKVWLPFLFLLFGFLLLSARWWRSTLWAADRRGNNSHACSLPRSRQFSTNNSSCFLTCLCSCFSFSSSGYVSWEGNRNLRNLPPTCREQRNQLRHSGSKTAVSDGNTFGITHWLHSLNWRKSGSTSKLRHKMWRSKLEDQNHFSND